MSSLNEELGFPAVAPHNEPWVPVDVLHVSVLGCIAGCLTQLLGRRDENLHGKMNKCPSWQAALSGTPGSGPVRVLCNVHQHNTYSVQKKGAWGGRGRD